jgi:iron-sulfur cluster insertion protein
MKITQACFDKIRSLKENPDQNLRVYVQGGGCSGMKYGFTWDENLDDEDTVFGCEDVRVVIDPISLEVLREATIDYKDGGLSGSHFVIDNPSAKTTCGCGDSFSS